jgi:MATE family multidrug resistance protein
MDRPRLPIPFIVASMVAGALQPLIALVDTYFAAQLSTQDLACLALGGGIASSVGWVGGQLIGGFPGVLGRLKGASKDDEAAQLAGQALWLAIGLGLILVTPLGWLLGHVVMAITESEATGSGARHYLQLRLLGLPFEMAGFVAFGVLRAGFHAVWTPILVMAVALIANSLYNAVLVFGFGLGLTGLALGSSLAALTAVGCASLPIGRWGGWRSAAGRRAVRRFELSPMTQLSVQLGGKALWRGLFLNAVLVGSSVYAERFSTPELAAHGLALQIWLLLAFVIDGFAHAGTAFGSQLIGSGEHRQARTLGWRLMRHSVILCIVLCTLLALSWSGIARLIGLDGVAQMAFAALLLPMMAQTVPASAAFVADGLLKGAGDLGFLATQMVAASALVFPIALVVLGDSLQGLWWAVCAWVTARALLCTWRLSGDRWIAVAVGQMRSKSS